MAEKNDMYIKNALALKPVVIKNEFISADKDDLNLTTLLNGNVVCEEFFTIRDFKKELDEALEIVKLRAEKNGNKSVYNIYLEAGIDISIGFNTIEVYSGKLVKILIVCANDDLSIILIVGDNYDCAANFKEAEEELLEWQSYIHEPIDTRDKICYTTNGLKPQIVDSTHDYIYNMELFGESLLRNYLLLSIKRDGRDYTMILDPSMKNSCDFVKNNTYMIVAVEELLKTINIIN